MQISNIWGKFFVNKSICVQWKILEKSSKIQKISVETVKIINKMHACIFIIVEQHTKHIDSKRLRDRLLF